MKRWALFLAIFLVGLGVLWVIDRGRRSKTPPAPPDISQSGEQPADVLTKVPLDKVQGKFAADGTFSSKTFDPATGKLRYQITARNHQSLGNGVYQFDDLVGRFYVAGSDLVRLELFAKHARGRLTSAPSLDFDRAYPVELEDVLATLLEGSPFVPLTMRVPRASGVFADETFKSADRVEIAGTGLSADGVGLSFDGKQRELRLERNTHASLTLKDGTPAALSAIGGLVFTSLEKIGEGASRVVAREKAHLQFEGPKPVSVDADEIDLDATVLRSPSTRVLPSHVAAHGSVRLTPVDGKFFGDHADLELDEAGRPQRATLKGSPRVELLLRDVDTASLPGGAEKPADLEVRMIGAGPLDVFIAGNSHFDFHGPATLMLPALDMNLTAQEKLSGARLETSDFGRLDALGGVEARWGTSILTSNALTIDRKLTKDGQIAAGLTTTGLTLSSGTLEDGSTFDLSAQNGLEFVRLPNSFQVPLARDVDLLVRGPKALHVKAREVRDFDELSRTFSAFGDVFFENAKGKGRGQRVISRGVNSAELFGAPTQPARVDLEQGWLEAREIVFDGERLRAEGEARAMVGVESTRYDLSARWIGLMRAPDGDGEVLTLTSGGDVVARIDDDRRRMDLTAQSIEAHAASPGKELKQLESRGLSASGSVVFHASGEQELNGEGEELLIAADRSGSLAPRQGGRVQLRGRLPKNAISFGMSSGVVGFSPTNLTAENPVIEIEGVDVPLGKGRTKADYPLRAVAGYMSVDPTSILFTDGVYLGQAATTATAWSLDAEKLVLTGVQTPISGQDTPRFTVSTVLAWGGFQASFAEQISAHGATLLLDRDRDRLTIRGEPAEFDYQERRLRTNWLEFELSTGFWRTSQGTLLPLDSGKGAYEISFMSMEPIYGLDSRVEVVREIRYVDKEKRRETRASWAVLWLDEQRLENLVSGLWPDSAAGRVEIPESPPRPVLKRNALLDKPLNTAVLDWVKEIYLEGNIEVLFEGERVVRADGMYVNLIDSHAWLRNIEVTTELPLRAMAHTAKLHADWARLGADGTVSAEHAVATTCEFEKPHYEIALGRVRLKPRPTDRALEAIRKGRSQFADETEGYEVRSTNNSLRFGDGPKIPLGPLTILTDEKFHVDPESFSVLGLPLLVIGNSAKFGFFIGASFPLTLNWVSKQVTQVMGTQKQPYNQRSLGQFRYLNLRGLLLGVNNKVEQKGVFKLTTDVSGIFDTGSDRGLVRVPKSDRESLRAWLHVGGRRLLGGGEWIDVNLTKQSDPGVQAEFFEGDFLRWEERETYLHWRKARGLDYARATLETQLDDWRTEVIEQPSFGYTRGRGAVTRWWRRDLLYSSDSSLAYLRRVEGDPNFEAPFADGFGKQEVLRADSTHRWELPVPLGFLAARLVPFVEARGTFWDRGATSSQEAGRFALLAGAEASTTFWRVMGDGDLHSLTPSLGVRGDVDVEETGPTPALFDGVEDPIAGRFADIGLRSRWVKPSSLGQGEGEERWLDIEVREAYAGDLQDGREPGWQPLRVNAQWKSEFASIPFGVTHDARYDVMDRDTIYSRSLLGVRPVPSVDLETGYHTAEDLNEARLYSAWSLAARYRYSDKWVFEGGQTFSSLSNSRLNSDFTLRRMGHDFIFELSYSFVAGEGGGSVGFSLKPLLAYREHGFGQLSRWQREGN